MLWLDPGIFDQNDLSSATSFLGGDRGVKRQANVWVSQADGVARIEIAVRQRDKRAEGPSIVHALYRTSV